MILKDVFKEINILVYLKENLKSEHISLIYGVHCSLTAQEIRINVIIEKYDKSLYKFINLWN